MTWIDLKSSQMRDIFMNLSSSEIRKDGNPVNPTTKEFDVFAFCIIVVIYSYRNKISR
jgi:hypothetical protein